uniref:Uncharacterized protein n=1 Tax=Leersia perrieri TaxID=77586 RepID=A0A0D9VGS7_9ORYZ
MAAADGDLVAGAGAGEGPIVRRRSGEVDLPPMEVLRAAAAAADVYSTSPTKRLHTFREILPSLLSGGSGSKEERIEMMINAIGPIDISTLFGKNELSKLSYEDCFVALDLIQSLLVENLSWVQEFFFIPSLLQLLIQLVCHPHLEVRKVAYVVTKKILASSAGLGQDLLLRLQQVLKRHKFSFIEIIATDSPNIFMELVTKDVSTSNEYAAQATLCSLQTLAAILPNSRLPKFEAFISLLKAIASACATAIATMNIFIITNLTQWPSYVGKNQRMTMELTLFIFFPIALITTGIAHAVEHDEKWLGYASTLVLLEFLYALAVGGGISIVLLTKPALPMHFWGRHPDMSEFLRSFLHKHVKGVNGVLRFKGAPRQVNLDGLVIERP